LAREAICELPPSLETEANNEPSVGIVNIVHVKLVPEAEVTSHDPLDKATRSAVSFVPKLVPAMVISLTVEASDAVAIETQGAIETRSELGLKFE